MELAKGLSPPQRASEVAEVAAGTPVSTVAAHEVAPDFAMLKATTHEVASDIATPAEVISEIVYASTPAIPKPDIIIVAGLGIDTIPLPPVMMHGIKTLSHSPITRLVFSHEFNSQYFIFLALFAFVFM